MGSIPIPGSALTCAFMRLLIRVVGGVGTFVGTTAGPSEARAVTGEQLLGPQKPIDAFGDRSSPPVHDVLIAQRGRR